jgi:hypothetical protein
MCVSISGSAKGKISQETCGRQFEIIIKGCNENDRDEKRVDVLSSFSAKIASKASSPLPIVAAPVGLRRRLRSRELSLELVQD